MLEFGNAGLHQEQRAGIIAHGPADVGIEGRCEAIRVGLVGDGRALGELRGYLESAASGLEGQGNGSDPAFPGIPRLHGHGWLSRPSRLLGRQHKSHGAQGACLYIGRGDARREDKGGR